MCRVLMYSPCHAHDLLSGRLRLLKLAPQQPKHDHVQHHTLLLHGLLPHALLHEPGFLQDALAAHVARVGDALEAAQRRPGGEQVAGEARQGLGGVALAPVGAGDPVADLPGAVEDVALGLDADAADEEGEREGLGGVLGRRKMALSRG